MYLKSISYIRVSATGLVPCLMADTAVMLWTKVGVDPFHGPVCMWFKRARGSGSPYKRIANTLLAEG